MTSFGLLGSKVFGEVLELRRVFSNVALVFAGHVSIGQVSRILADIEEILEVLLAEVGNEGRLHRLRFNRLQVHVGEVRMAEHFGDAVLRAKALLLIAQQ